MKKTEKNVSKTNNKKVSSFTKLIKCDFKKPKDKATIIFIAIGIFICVTCLANWIATSFGTFDDDMQSIFSKAMDIPFFRGWASYTVCDGYISMVAFIIAGIPLLYESLVIYSKKYKPNWWFARHASSSYKGVFWFFAILFEVIIIVVYWGFNWADIGIGAGYNLEFMTGPEYQFPEFIVSLVLTNAIFWATSWWFHFRLARRQDFLQLKIWRRIISWYLFLIINYVVCLILKWTMVRPYWYQIHWYDGYTGSALMGDQQWAIDNGLPDIKTVGGYQIKGALERLKEWYPAQYDYYMHNNIWSGMIGKFENGHKILAPFAASDAYDRNWLWFHTSSRSVMQGALAFPSGHVVATAAMGLFIPMVMFSETSKSKKQTITKNSLTTLGFIYELDMLFALQVSSSHWWSDSMFGIAFIPFFLVIGWLISNAAFDGMNKRFNTNNY